MSTENTATALEQAADGIIAELKAHPESVVVVNERPNAVIGARMILSKFKPSALSVGAMQDVAKAQGFTDSQAARIDSTMALADIVVHENGVIIRRERDGAFATLNNKPNVGHRALAVLQKSYNLVAMFRSQARALPSSGTESDGSLRITTNTSNNHNEGMTQRMSLEQITAFQAPDSVDSWSSPIYSNQVNRDRVLDEMFRVCMADDWAGVLGVDKEDLIANRLPETWMKLNSYQGHPGQFAAWQAYCEPGYTIFCLPLPCGNGWINGFKIPTPYGWEGVHMIAWDFHGDTFNTRINERAHGNPIMVLCSTEMRRALGKTADHTWTTSGNNAYGVSEAQIFTPHTAAAIVNWPTSMRKRESYTGPSVMTRMAPMELTTGPYTHITDADKCKVFGPYYCLGMPDHVNEVLLRGAVTIDDENGTIRVDTTESAICAPTQVMIDVEQAQFDSLDTPTAEDTKRLDDVKKMEGALLRATFFSKIPTLPKEFYKQTRMYRLMDEAGEADRILFPAQDNVEAKNMKQASSKVEGKGIGMAVQLLPDPTKIPVAASDDIRIAAPHRVVISLSGDPAHETAPYVNHTVWLDDVDVTANVGIADMKAAWGRGALVRTPLNADRNAFLTYVFGYYNPENVFTRDELDDLKSVDDGFDDRSIAPWDYAIPDSMETDRWYRLNVMRGAASRDQFLHEFIARAYPGHVYSKAILRSETTA